MRKPHRRIHGWGICATWGSPGRAETAVRPHGSARAAADAHALRWIIVIGGFGQLVGAALYFIAMWPRIRPVGSHLREAQGERF